MIPLWTTTNSGRGVQVITRKNRKTTNREGKSEERARRERERERGKDEVVGGARKEGARGKIIELEHSELKLSFHRQRRRYNFQNFTVYILLSPTSPLPASHLHTIIPSPLLSSDRWGWLLTSLGTPWVAQRVCAIPTWVVNSTSMSKSSTAEEYSVVEKYIHMVS